jgi:hypothetical protein
VELPTPIHVLYIPAIFFIGLVVGWALRGKVKVVQDDED